MAVYEGWEGDPDPSDPLLNPPLQRNPSILSPFTTLARRLGKLSLMLRLSDLRRLLQTIYIFGHVSTGSTGVSL